MDVEALKEQYRYEPLTGLLYNKWGSKVGCYTKTYPVVSYRGKELSIHRLAYLLMGISIPADKMVDHINRDKHDNRWSNLRLVDRSLNKHNSDSQKGLPRGVFKQGSKFVAQLRKGGINKFKRFDTLEEASAQYAVWSLEVYEGNNKCL